METITIKDLTQDEVDAIYLLMCNCKPFYKMAELIESYVYHEYVVTQEGQSNLDGSLPIEYLDSKLNLYRNLDKLKFPDVVDAYDGAIDLILLKKNFVYFAYIIGSGIRRSGMTHKNITVFETLKDLYDKICRPYIYDIKFSFKGYKWLINL